MLFREEKSTTWEEDMATAEKYAEILKQKLSSTEEYIDQIRELTEEKVETVYGPAEPYRDGYGNREIWLQTELAVRKLEAKWVSEKKVMIKQDLYNTGIGIIVRENLIYCADDGMMYEQNRITVMQ